MYELKKYLNDIFANNKNITITARKANNTLDGLVEATDKELKELYDEYITYITTHSPNDKDNALGGSSFNTEVIRFRTILAFTEIEIKTPTKTFIITSWGEIVDLDNQNPDEITYKEAIRNFDIESSNDSYTIYKYKGNEKTVRIPKMIAGEPVTGLDAKKDDPDADYYSIFVTKHYLMALDDEHDAMFTDELTGEALEFKEENFEKIINILLPMADYFVGDLNSCDTFHKLKDFLCAFEVKGHWYSIYSVTEDEKMQFVNKSERLGVEKVIIPDNITTISSHTFQDSPWLTSIYISAETMQATKLYSYKFEGSYPGLKVYVTKPESWGKAEKENLENEFFKDKDGYTEDDCTFEIIWSDEPEYVAP